MGRILKFTISSFVFLGDAILMLLTRMAGQTPAGKCVIVYYHSVPPGQRQRFARQLDSIRRRATVVSLGQAFDLNQGTMSLAITFDDAFENFVTCALPELEKRGMPATMFVITDALNKAFGPPNTSEKVMSTEQLKALPTSLVTIGSHTLTHPMLPELPLENARRQIAESKKVLELMLGRGVELFSFPFGGFTAELVECCREAGYQRAFSTLPFFAFEKRDEFFVGRVRVDPTDWPLEFNLKIAGAYRWLPLAIRIKRAILEKLAGSKNGGAEVARHTEDSRSAIRELGAH